MNGGIWWRMLFLWACLCSCFVDGWIKVLWAQLCSITSLLLHHRPLKPFSSRVTNENPASINPAHVFSDPLLVLPASSGSFLLSRIRDFMFLQLHAFLSFCLWSVHRHWTGKRLKSGLWRTEASDDTIHFCWTVGSVLTLKLTSSLKTIRGNKTGLQLWGSAVTCCNKAVITRVIRVITMSVQSRY